MDKKPKSQNKKSPTVFTTGQTSGYTQVSLKTLQNYVKEFPEFFGSHVQPGMHGRRWTPEDVEMVQAIRCLKHERAGTEKIRDLIASGWKLQDNQAWTRELISKLIESILAKEEEGEELATQMAAMNRIIETSKRNDQEFKSLWILVKDLEEEWKLMQKAQGIRTPMVKALKYKKRYHGTLPSLYAIDKE